MAVSPYQAQSNLNWLGSGTQPPGAIPAPPTASTGYKAPSASPASGQDPNALGLGTFHPQAYPINMGAITNTSQTGDIWNRLQNSLGGLQPQSYQTQAAQLGAAPQFGAAQGIGATGMAAQAAPAWWQAAYGSAPLGTAAQGGYSIAGPTGISTAGDLAWQAQQQQLANVLARQAAGGGVSPADIQLRQGLDQSIGSQLSVLGSQRGNMGNAALTARAAADQGASAEAQFNAQMGMQRAQETLAAQQALGGVLGQARGQAQNYNINQAGLIQQMSLADLANAQAAQMQNTGFRQQTGLANLSDVQAMQLANLGYRNQALQGNAQLGQSMTLANLNAQNQFGLSNLGNAQQMGLANLGNLQQQNLANQTMLGQYGLTQGQFNQQANLANQQMAYAGQGQYYNQLNALLGAGAGVAESNRAAQLAAQQLAVQQQIAQNQVAAQAYAASAANQANFAGSVANAVGGLGAGLINQFGGAGGGTPVGPSAQDLQNQFGDNPQTAPTSDASGNPFVTIPSDRRGKTAIRSAGDTVYALLRASSDENLKTGIQGGNPMLSSYLRQFNEARGRTANIDPTAGESFQLTRGPGTMVGGSAGGGGSAWGKVLGVLSPIPFVGPFLAGLGGAIDASSGGSSGTPARQTPGPVQARGMIGNENISDAPDYSQLAGIGQGDVDASSDDREKEAIMGGNRGIQAFLQQQNAQQGAQANQGGMSNTFMQSGSPPTAQMDRQMPYNPNMGYGAPQFMQTPMQVGYGSDAGLSSMGGIYGGGYGVGGVTQGTTLNPGGIASQGGQFAGQQTGSGAFMQPSAAPPPYNPISMANTVPNTSEVSRAAPAVQPYASWQGTGYTPAPGFGNLVNANPVQSSGIPITTMAPSYITRAASDEEQKTAVEPSKENLQEMLDALHAYSYRYKDPNAPGAAPGRRVGVMAQDLERSPLGDQFVVDTPHGKMVNYGQAAGTMMAGLAYHNERLDQHEQMLRALLSQGGNSGGSNTY